MSRSGSPPELFIDRSLGRHQIPEALRARRVVIHTMADVYGEQIGQGLDDERWLRDAGQRGWVVLMKDSKVRYRPAELQALADHGVRAFCLMNANLRGYQQAERFVASLDAIVRIAEHPGPYIYGVYALAIRQIWPVP